MTTKEAAVLYLLTPPDTIRWSDTSSSLLAAATENGANLAQLDWQPSERRGIADVLPLALRYGVKCSTGLVLAGHHVSDADHPRQITETHRAANESHARNEASHGAFMESVLPGWTEHEHETTARADAQSAAAAQRAQEKADQALALPQDDDLAAHWTALGGDLPTA